MYRQCTCVAALLIGQHAIGAPPSGAYSKISVYSTTAAGVIQGIVAGPDGAMWFTETNGIKIGRITTAGVLTEYPVPGDSTRLGGIAAGPDGALWFADPGEESIGRITTAGVFTIYPALSANGSPNGIAAGPDGALWFTSGTAIGRITTTGSFSFYAIPGFYSALDIAAGPDGALWFTEEASGIGRVTVDGVVSRYATPGDGCPNGITAGPDGALWFTELCSGKIGRMSTDGDLTEYPLQTTPSSPNYITAGPDGALWFTNYGGAGGLHGGVARITTTGAVTQFPVPSGTYGPSGIAAGPDGALWFGTYFINTPSQIQRAPACALGFSASFGGDALTMNFNLGIDTPATLNVFLHTPAGVTKPYSHEIPATVPPRTFSVVLSPFPDLGTVTIEPTLSTDPGGAGLGLCGEWATVNTQ
jgi:streptogramin lyase